MMNGAHNTSLLPFDVEQRIVDDILDGRMSQDKALAYRKRLLNEYDANGTLILHEGDKYGIEYASRVLSEKFDTHDEAEAWALWNYKGSRRGWRIIAQKR